MNMGIGKIAVATTLSLTLCMTPTFAAYANEATNSPPQTPRIENLSTNEANRLITDYNAEIDEYNKIVEQEYYNQLNEATNYNKSVDEYNAQVDLEYEQALKENEKQNSEIVSHNTSEEQRVTTENAINEQRQQEADNRNTEIDVQNAIAEQNAKEAAERNAQKIADKKEYDAQIDADYEAAVIAENERVANANAAEDARIEQVKQNNIEVQDQYDKDMTQYNIDYAQYEKDKEFEAYLISKGYESVEQYNEAVAAYNIKVEKYNSQVTAYNTAYGMTNETAAATPEMNSSTAAIDINQTYAVQEGTKTGRKIPVHLEHNFYGTSLSYSEDFEIDAADIITFMGIAALVNVPIDGSCYFFYNADNSHSLGMWVNSDSYLATNPTGDISQGWQNGDTHTITYKNSTNEYQWNFEDITMIYNYWWIPLYTIKDYYDYANIPNEPTKPTLELEDETPHYITPDEITRGEYMVIELEDETYNLIPHIVPEFINVIPADIWQLIDKPIKGDYLSYMPYPDYPVLLAHMDYLKEAAQNIINDQPVRQLTFINDEPISTPLTRSINPQKAYADTIDDNSNPMDAGQTQQVWALVNLILMLITILILIKVPRRKEDDQTDKYYYKHHNNIIGILLAIAAVILFILTENVWLPMVMVDSWTIWMAFICGGAIVARFFNRTTKEKIEE